MPLAAARVTVYRAGCPDRPEPACAWHAPERIWLEPGPFRTRQTLLHELGHVFDFTTLWNADRARFEDLVDDHRAWWGEGPNAPREKFAEAYQLCARRWSLRARAHEAYEYSPTPALHRRVCALIRAVGRRERLPVPCRARAERRLSASRPTRTRASRRGPPGPGRARRRSAAPWFRGPRA